MENELSLPGKTLQLHGKVRISCGDNQFSVDFQEGRTVVEFPSFSRLLKVKSEIDSLCQAVSRLPPLPGGGSAGKRAAPSRVGLDLPEFRLTVRGRSIGKLDFEGGDVKFHLTPFDFITKRMS